MDYQIRIATADIFICKQDKRKRYGLESVGTIKAGTKIKFLPGDYANMHPAWVDVGSTSGPIKREVAEAIEANSTLVTGDTYSDFINTKGREGYAAGHVELIDELINRGLLKLEDVKTVYNELNESDE